MLRIRTALGVLGGFGLLLWPILSISVWMFHGFKPGGAEGGLSAFQAWFCALSLIGVSAYYVTVAGVTWNRRLFGVGVALHGALLVAIVMLVSFTGGGFLIAPVMFVGPILWMIYATRIRKSKTAAQPDAAHESPSAAAVQPFLDNMKPKLESEAPADSGGR